MSTLDEMKKVWDEVRDAGATKKVYDYATVEKIVRSRTKKEINKSMCYFWASFTLQILVYALLSHVIIKYGENMQTLLFAAAGIVLYIPFTIMLMRKFKKMAITKPQENSGSALYQYVKKQHGLLTGFYVFKKRYELIMVPLSSSIGIFLTFKLYVPGGVAAHPVGAMIALAITLLSCAWAIMSENKKSFEEPIKELQTVLDEFQRNAVS